MRVTLQDSRTFIGKFMAYDNHLNLVLADCEEFRRVVTKGKKEEKEEKRTLGLVILRGETVVSMTVEAPPADDSRVKALDRTQAGGPGTAQPAGRGVPSAAGGPAPGLSGPARGLGGPAPGMMMPQPAASAPPVNYGGRGGMPMPPPGMPPMPPGMMGRGAPGMPPMPPMGGPFPPPPGMMPPGGRGQHGPPGQQPPQGQPPQGGNQQQ